MKLLPLKQLNCLPLALFFLVILQRHHTSVDAFIAQQVQQTKRKINFFGTIQSLQPIHRHSQCLQFAKARRKQGQDFQDDAESVAAELLTNNDDNDEGAMHEELDWLPDREKARIRREQSRRYIERIRENNSDDISHGLEKTKAETKSSATTFTEPDLDNNIDNSRPSSPYTDEEEAVIASMGGKTLHRQRRRQEGYLGDSTLAEIATDYSVPICYLADVLCMWGVPPPVDLHERLGDLVTGEQAFAILEAINSLDMAALQDRYSNYSLVQLCYEYNVDLQAAFEMAMKEGWSLPFGVQTCLRVEQEDELLRLLSDYDIADKDDDD